MPHVIAVGPKGGKIVGYAGGDLKRPIYHHDTEAVSLRITASDGSPAAQARARGLVVVVDPVHHDRAQVSWPAEAAHEAKAWLEAIGGAHALPSSSRPHRTGRRAMLVVPRAWLESPAQGVTKAMVAAGVSAVAKSSLSVWGVKSWLESAQHPVETPAGAGVYLGECMAPNSETRTGQVLVRLGSGEVAAFGKAVVKPATNVLQGSWAHSQCRVWKSDQAAALVGAALAKPLKNSGGKTGHDAVQTLAAAGHATYVVGGLVRDALRGEPGNDIDVTFTCSNVTVAKVCGDAGFKIPSYSPNPVSGLVELGHENPNEDAGKIQGKQFVVSNCGKTYSPPPPKTKGACAVEDSVYRDFACNALFYDPINGVVLDPTGIGARDAIEKRLSIPAPKARWQEWADHQAAAVLRYWKFRSRGYTPADDATRAFVLAQAKAVEAGTIAPAIYGSISGMSATKRTQFKAVCVEDMGQGWWDTHMKSKVGF